MTAVLTILDAVEARLKLINKPRGYKNTLQKVDRARIKIWNGYDLPAVSFWPTNLASEKNDYGETLRTLEIFVEGHSQTRDEPFSDVADRLAADIVTALYRTPDNPTTADAVTLALGGLVEQFNFLGYKFWIGEGQEPMCGVLINFEVKYHAPIGDMQTIGV